MRRNIRTSTISSHEELADAIQGLFVAELLMPSEPLWIISPWISDITVIDNRTGRFKGLLPDMPRREIHLSEVLISQLQRGGSLVIASRPVDHNRLFIDHLIGRAYEVECGNRIRCHQAEDLHEKGILARGLYLEGSMNITYNGIRRLEEAINLSDSDDTITRTRQAFEDRWGRN